MSVMEDRIGGNPHPSENDHDKIGTNEGKSSRSCSDPDADIEKGDVKVNITEDMDDAAKTLAKYAGEEPLVVTPEDNKRLLRLIDWHLMPVMCIIYGLNFLDSMLSISFLFGHTYI